MFFETQKVIRKNGITSALTLSAQDWLKIQKIGHGRASALESNIEKVTRFARVWGARQRSASATRLWLVGTREL